MSVRDRCQDYPLNDADDLVDEWKGCIAQAMEKYSRRIERREAREMLIAEEDEIMELKKMVEKLESRGVLKLHLEIKDLQSQLAAQTDKQQVSPNLPYRG
ncbi:hypothetical protein ACEPPN_010730 [Leptodophora sp. 'Broadleaf-Isolate-01']